MGHFLRLNNCLTCSLNIMRVDKQAGMTSITLEIFLKNIFYGIISNIYDHFYL